MKKLINTAALVLILTITLASCVKHTHCAAYDRVQPQQTK
jgi:hypothetical protein